MHFPFPLTLAGSPYNKCTFTIRVYYRRIRWPIFRPLFCCFIRTRCPLHTGEGEGHGFCFDLSYISLPSKFHQVGAQFARLNSSSEISRRRAKADVERVVEIFSRMGIDMILASIDIIFQAHFFFYSLQKVLTFFSFEGKEKSNMNSRWENSTVENCSSRFILIRNCARYGNSKTGSRC